MTSLIYSYIIRCRDSSVIMVTRLLAGRRRI